MSDQFDSVTITIEGDRVALRLTESDPKKGKSEVLPLLQDELDIQVLTLCTKLIEDNQIRTRDDFKLIGRLLHKALFAEDARRDFQLIHESTRPNAEKRLRVELKFIGLDTRGLFKLPWEYLCYEDNLGNWNFVSTVAELVLTRHLPPAPVTPTLVGLSDKKINVLLVVLNPNPNGKDGHGDLADVGNKVRGQLIQFKESLSKHNLEVVLDPMLPPVTWENFQDKIEDPDCQPHILHLVAHGNFDGDNQSRFGQIAFHHFSREPEVGVDGGNINWKSDRDFANVFNQANKLPRFAFLHMCKGGAIDKQHSSAGVALKLAELGVPAVVAMQHPIETGTSEIFSEAFYESLSAGRAIDEAVQLSRARIEALNRADRAFGTPVLYLSTRGDSILPKIPRRNEEPQPKASVVITIDVGQYQMHLVPILTRYHDDAEKKAKKMIRELDGQLASLFTKPSDEWLSELRKVYQLPGDFGEEFQLRRALCSDLIRKIEDLARPS